MSPKGDLALILANNELYVATVPKVGAVAPTISVTKPDSAAMPVRKLSDIGGEFPVWAWNDMISKGLIIRGSWHFNLTDAPLLLNVIAANGPQIDKLITHRLPMSAAQRAFELQLTGECGKVLLDPWA